MTKILIDEAVRDAAYMEHRLQRAAKIEGEFNRRLKDAIRDGHSDTPGTARECLLASVREDFIDEKRLWDVAWESALRQALANEALDKMADNERELGIQMQPTVPWSQELESVWAEPDEQPAQQNSTWCMKMNGCKTKCEDCPDEAIEAAHGITKGD